MVAVIPKDGCSSWLYLALVSFVTFFVIGFLDSYGVFMVFLVDHYNESNSKTAWVGSLTFFCAYSLYPFTLTMRYKMGTGFILFIAAMLVVPTFLISPLTQTMNLLFVTFSIPFGITCSVVECATFTTIQEYFRKYRGVAFGTRMGTATLGTMMYSFLLPFLMTNFGWNWTFWLMTGMSLICLFFACVLSTNSRLSAAQMSGCGDLKAETNKLTVDVNIEEPVQEKEREFFSSYFKSLKDKRFLVYLLASTVFCSVVLMPPIFMVRFATNIGSPISEAKWLMVVRTITSAMTRFTVGRFLDLAFKHKKVRHIVIFNMILFSLATMLCSMTTSFPLLMLYMAFVSILDSVHWTIQPLLIAEITNTIYSDKGFALINCFGSFALLVGPPALGLLYDKTGDFNSVFYTTSCVSAIGACLMAVGLCLPSTKEMSLHSRNDLTANNTSCTVTQRTVVGCSETQSIMLGCSDTQRIVVASGNRYLKLYQLQYTTTV